MKIETALKVLKECQIDVTCHRILGKELTQIQFGILLALIRAGEEVLTRKDIIRNIGIRKPITERNIDVHVMRIREKFGYGQSRKFPIETVQSNGYRIDQKFLEMLNALEEKKEEI